MITKKTKLYIIAIIFTTLGLFSSIRGFTNYTKLTGTLLNLTDLKAETIAPGKAVQGDAPWCIGPYKTQRHRSKHHTSYTHYYLIYTDNDNYISVKASDSEDGYLYQLASNCKEALKNSNYVKTTFDASVTGITKRLPENVSTELKNYVNNINAGSTNPIIDMSKNLPYYIDYETAYVAKMNIYFGLFIILCGIVCGFLGYRE